MFGPHVQRRQAKLIAFIDDASRVLCHGEFFLEENTDSMVQCLRAAFYKRGVPEQLLVDNGSVYCSQEITLICARVGCILRHTAVRDAAAKGKIERFFRRVRDQFLVRKLDLSSLEELNKQFTHWVERDYNAAEHSTLGMKPIDRFGMDLSRIRFLSPSEDADELFYAEAVRTVKKDNTFSFQGVRYETPVDLRGRKVQLRHQRGRQGAVVVYDQARRMGLARPLDAVANGLRRRGKSGDDANARAWLLGRWTRKWFVWHFWPWLPRRWRSACRWPPIGRRSGSRRTTNGNIDCNEAQYEADRAAPSVQRGRAGEPFGQSHARTRVGAKAARPSGITGSV